MVSFMTEVQYTPDSNIVIDEPLRDHVTHEASEVRPVSGNAGTTLQIAYDDEPEPSVTIDLDVPYVTDSALDVEQVIVKGNVQTVTVYYKDSDSDSTWHAVTSVHVGPGGVLSWPSPGAYVSVAVLKIVPTEATALYYEFYTFTVEIYGCAEKYSECIFNITILSNGFGFHYFIPLLFM